MSGQAATAGPPGVRPRERAGVRLAREVAIIVLALLAYRLARLITSGEVDQAMDNAGRVLDLERALKLPGELGLQQLVLPVTWLVESANVYYAIVHFPATALFMVWTYLRHREHYAWVRNSLIGLTAVALAVHLFVPLAPPRMLGGHGFVDTGAVVGPAVYGPPETDDVSNQYAAMPSLHVGWAVFVALGLIVMTRSRLRWLALLHPLVTGLVVVVTANHYWIDGLVAVLLLGLVLLAQGRPPAPRPPAARRRSGPQVLARPVPPPVPPLPGRRRDPDEEQVDLALRERHGCRRC